MYKRPIAPLESGGRKACVAAMATGRCGSSMRSKRKKPGPYCFYLRVLQGSREYGPLCMSRRTCESSDVGLFLVRNKSKSLPILAIFVAKWHFRRNQRGRIIKVTIFGRKEPCMKVGRVKRWAYKAGSTKEATP